MEETIKGRIIEAIKTGKSLKDISVALYISEHQLKLLLKSWDVEIPGRRAYKRMDRPAREEVMKLYHEHRTTGKVAAHYKVGINTVNRWMRELKIPTRRMKKLTELERVGFLEEHLEKLGDIQL